MTSRRGFTLIEVLATLILMGIVLPVAMRGVSVALAAASRAKHLSIASGLAEQKLNQLIVENAWSSSQTSGDFTPDHPDYTWTCQSATRDYGVSEIELRVNWIERGQQRSFVVSTLAYESAGGGL